MVASHFYISNKMECQTVGPTVTGTFQAHNQATHNYGHSNVCIANAFSSKEINKALVTFICFCVLARDTCYKTHTKLVTWPQRLKHKFTSSKTHLKNQFKSVVMCKNQRVQTTSPLQLKSLTQELTCFFVSCETLNEKVSTANEVCGVL